MSAVREREWLSFYPLRLSYVAHQAQANDVYRQHFYFARPTLLEEFSTLFRTFEAATFDQDLH